MTQKKLKKILSQRLKLKDPEFFLERILNKLSGSVVSITFKGKSDQQRLKMVWDALEDELGPEAVQQIGTLLLYSPDEWNMDLEGHASSAA